MTYGVLPRQIAELLKKSGNSIQLFREGGDDSDDDLVRFNTSIEGAGSASVLVDQFADTCLDDIKVCCKRCAARHQRRDSFSTGNDLYEARNGRE